MRILVSITVLLLSAIVANSQDKNFYDFKVKNIDGSEFEFSNLKGKKVMIVNTASKCGFTPQYEGLQELYEKYGGDGFIIIGFPANNFRNQEPGSDAEIRDFCTRNFGVAFPMMSKISVKGEDIHPLYKWLTKKELNGVSDSEVKWNFQKYLIDENGKLVMVLAPRVKPMSDDILNWLAG